MRGLFLSLLLAVLFQMAGATVTPRPESLVPLARARLYEAAASPVLPLDYVNRRVNSDNTTQVQNEEMACISPLDSQNFVAAWRDFRLGYRRIGVGYTTDGGQVWHDTLLPQMFYPWQSDPVMVVNHEGVFTTMIVTFDPAPGGEDGLLQVSSNDGGVTWHDSVFAADSVQPLGFEDKEMLAVDADPTSPYLGTYYTAWAHFYGPNPYDSTHIWLVYKRPGEPYSTPRVLSQTSGNQWANVCTGPDGEVYVSWLSYALSGLMFSRSTDGGQTFADQQFVTSTNFVAAEIAPRNMTPEFDIFAYGAMAVDLSNGPHRGRLYMVFTDADAAFTRTDIYSMYSDDHGANWSPRRRLNDDNTAFPVDHLHPWISVDEEGRAWVVFYDRRNDPNNILMDVYFTLSTDGGATWRANERLSTISSNPAAGSSLDAGLIGEYIGWQARHGKALCTWTDTRLGNQDVFATYIDTIQFPTAVSGHSSFILPPSSFNSFPNPTNGSAMLRYVLDSPQDVRIRLYNVLGQIAAEVNLGRLAAGEHTYALDLNRYASGLYFAELTSQTHHTFTKVMLLK
ncbi:MAG TPA: T9SS type A sorting domain-containing protein [bacterium]|jgi:hypothetical protein